MAKPENILITPIVKKLQSETFHFLLNNGNASLFAAIGGCGKVNHILFQISDESFSFLFIWKVFSRKKKYFFRKSKQSTQIFREFFTHTRKKKAAKIHPDDKGSV